MEQIRLKRHYLTLQEFFGLNSRLSSQQQINYFQEKLIEDSFQRKRTLQLVNEEIILEVSAEMSEEIASHVVHTFTLATQMSQEHLMTCAIQEGKTNNNPQKKEKLTSFWHQYQSERDKSGDMHALLVSSVRLLLLQDLTKFITENNDSQQYVDEKMKQSLVSQPEINTISALNDFKHESIFTDLKSFMQLSTNLNYFKNIHKD